MGKFVPCGVARCHFFDTMVTIQHIATHLESVAPLHYQEPYDNVGLLVGDPSTEVLGVLLTLDVTPAVLKEAVEKKCNLVVSHHPLPFHPLKKFTDSDLVTQCLTFALKHSVALYAIHTNLDNAPNGLNQALGSKLGLQRLCILAPRETPTASAPVVGAGMIGSLAQPLTPEAFLAHLKKTLHTPILRYTDPVQSTIQKVAVCGGSGAHLLHVAQEQQADAYVTADIKYHHFFEAAHRILFVDVGHYESEVIVKEHLYNLLFGKFANIALLQSELDTNPFHYYV